MSERDRFAMRDFYDDYGDREGPRWSKTCEAVETRELLDACDTSRYRDGEFDAVLAFGGPLSYAFRTAAHLTQPSSGHVQRDAAQPGTEPLR
jgi:hypothetical protein